MISLKIDKLNIKILKIEKLTLLKNIVFAFFFGLENFIKFIYFNIIDLG